MVARGPLATLGVAAVAAAALGQGAHASPQPTLRRLFPALPRGGDTIAAVEADGELDQSCFAEITSLREDVDLQAVTEESGGPGSDLDTFKSKVKCADVVAGKFQRKYTESGQNIFVFSIPNVETSGVECTEVIKTIKDKGIEELNKRQPPPYQEYDKGTATVFDNPHATALAALLHDKESLKVFCGRLTTTNCTEKTNSAKALVCYLKGVDITQNPMVSGKVWGKLLRTTDEPMPTFSPEDLSTADEDPINEMKTFRGEYGISTTLTTVAAPEEFHTITCADLKDEGTVHKFSDKNTFFYALKNTKKSAAGGDFRAYWEDALKAFRGQPPNYTDDVPEEYKKNANRAALILLSGAKEIFCKKFTTCTIESEEEAVLCAVKGKIFNSGSRPFEDDIWKKVEDKAKIVPKFDALNEKEVTTFFAKSNEFRKEAKLAPLMDSKAGTGKARSVQSQVAKQVSCHALRSGDVAPVLEADSGKFSLLYYIPDAGSFKTEHGTDAFEKWKKGYKDYLKDKEVLPAYTIHEVEPYNHDSVNNFVTMASPNAGPVTCYKTKGCLSEGLVCELSPAVLKNEEVPIPAGNWTEIRRAMGDVPPEDPNGGDNTDDNNGDDNTGDNGSGSGTSPITVGSVAVVAALVAAAQLL